MGKPIHILILEDNPADIDLVEFELKEAGVNYISSRVMTKKDYMHELQAFSPDVILSDYDLPQYNGAQALQDAKTKYPDIPFILVTGAISEDRAIEILTGGAKDYVMKNRLQRLVPAIQRVLEEVEELHARKKAQEDLRNAHQTLEDRIKKRTAKLRAEILERKKTEKALRESQLNTDTLLNSATESIWMFGIDGEILAANETAVKRLGMTVSDAIGKKWADLIPHHLVLSRKKVIEKVIRTGKPVDLEDERAGIFFHHTYYPAKDVQGNIIGVTSFSRDITESKKAQDELLESKNKVHTILNSITDFYISYDLQWHIVDMNIQMEKLLGKNKDKLIGKVLWEVFPEMKEGEFHHQFQKAYDFNTPAHFDARSVFGKWFETHAYPSASGLDVYLRDVTMRKQAEELLQKSEERYSTTLASIGDAVMATDITGRITFINKVAEELTGWSFNDAWQKPAKEIFRIINEQTRCEVKSPVDRVLEKGMIVGLANHTILMRKDNSEIAIDDSGAPIRNAQGETTGVVLVFRDITDRRKKEDQMQRLNRTLKALSNSRHAMLHASDEIAYMNEICRIIVEDCGHAMVWIGLARQDKTKSVYPAAYAGFEEGYLESLNISWDDTERGQGPTGTAIRIGKQSSCRNMLTDPQFKPWRAEAMKRGYASSLVLPLIEESKAFGALNIYSKDPELFTEDEEILLNELASDLAYGITTIRLRAVSNQAELALRERTAQLEAVNKELESFSYSVSHDLRAPLRAMEGFSRILVRDLREKIDDQSLSKLTVVQNNANKMSQLIDSLLAFSRLERQSMKMKDVNMSEAVREVWNDLSADTEGRHVTLTVGDLGTAWADKKLIRQVLVNLLANAVKFTRDKKKARIEVSRENKPDEIVYYVKDNGAGFDMNYSGKLFGIFQRLHSEEEYEGTGVGLSIVKQIVRRHGGRVWAEGKINEGATLYFSLPRS